MIKIEICLIKTALKLILNEGYPTIEIKSLNLVLCKQINYSLNNAINCFI